MRKMKDSGIDIVTDIPYNWEMCCLRHLCTIETGNQDTQNADPTGAFPFYVRSPIIERSNTYTFDGEGILIAGDGAGAGRIFHYAFGKYAVHQRVYRLANFNKINSRFLFIYLSCLFEKEVEKGSAQSTVPSIRLPMLKSFIICVPSLIEQQKIVDYLDNKCSKIDEITSKIKTTINEYKNLKQSVITEVVTKGIRHNREMKDSGIEWIGEIPIEWLVAELKFFCKVNNGKGINVEINQGYENAISVYGSGGVFKYTDNYMYDGIAVMFGRKGTLGKPLYVSGKFWVVDTMYYLTYGKKIVPKFNYYQLCVFNWEPFITHTAVPSIVASQIVSEKFVYPDIVEQQEIVNYLDKKCAEIDALIAKKEQLVTELENYKKSLIYEVVTGKKEV